MERKDFVNEVFSKLEETHINLYHSISKEEFEKHKNEFLKVCDKLDEIHFEAGINQLFALFKDGHTMPILTNFYPVGTKIICIGKNYYIKNPNTNKFEEITHINGTKIEEVERRLSKFLCYENEAHRVFLTKDALSLKIYLSFADVAKITDDSVTYTTESGKIIAKSIPKPNENDTKNKTTKRKFYYKFELLDDLLYVRYFRCIEDTFLPFSKFMEEIKTACKTLPKACLLDVRDNCGGDNFLIHPLRDWLKENRIKSYVLANEGTFSSGRFAVVDFKLDLHAKLLGTTIGSPAVAYGNTKIFTVDGKSFTTSTKFFDFSEKLGYSGDISPDVVIEQDIEEINQGKNSQRNRAVEYVKNDMRIREEKTLT